MNADSALGPLTYRQVADSSGVAFRASPWATLDDDYPEATLYVWAVPPLPTGHEDASA